MGQKGRIKAFWEMRKLLDKRDLCRLQGCAMVKMRPGYAPLKRLGRK